MCCRTRRPGGCTISMGQRAWHGTGARPPGRATPGRPGTSSRCGAAPAHACLAEHSLAAVNKASADARTWLPPHTQSGWKQCCAQAPRAPMTFPENTTLAVRSRSRGRTSGPRLVTRRAPQMQPRQRQRPTPRRALQDRRIRAAGAALLPAASRRPEQWSSTRSVSARQAAGLTACLLSCCAVLKGSSQGAALPGRHPMHAGARDPPCAGAPLQARWCGTSCGTAAPMASRCWWAATWTAATRVGRRCRAWPLRRAH